MSGDNTPSTSNEEVAGCSSSSGPTKNLSRDDNEDWAGVVSALRKLHCRIITHDELVRSPRGIRTRPKCSVEGCYLDSPKFLCRLPMNFELAFHCLASSYSTIIVQNRLMTKLFNKTVLTKAFLNTKNDLKNIPLAVVDSFPYHVCHRHFMLSPKYYADIFWEGRPKSLLFNHLPPQSANNINEAGQVRQRAYLLVKLNIVDSKILPEVGIRKQLPVIDATQRVQLCAIDGCDACVQSGAKNLHMLNIPRIWQEFHKWERSVWFGLQRDYCLPSVGNLCVQHFSSIMLNPAEQEPPILFHSVKRPARSEKPSCVVPSCRNHLSSDDNLLYVPFPSSPSDRSAWVVEIRKHHSNFTLDPKKRVEWVCCLHFTDLSSLETAKPSVNLGESEQEELSIGSPLISQPNYSTSFNPLYVSPATGNEEKKKAPKRRCCAETAMIFTKLAKLQEKSLTVFKLIEELYVLYGLTPLKEDSHKDVPKVALNADGREVKNQNLNRNVNTEPKRNTTPNSNTSAVETQNGTSPLTLADALAGLINRK